MKKNMMRRNLHQSIKRSLARYIAIVAIIALGAGLFVGLRTTKSDMVATGQRYMDEQNMFDLRLLSSYGWSMEDLDKIAELEGVKDAEGVISLDVIASYEGSQAEGVYKVFSVPKTVNKVYLHGGRMPMAPDECLADGFHIGDEVLGKKVVISQGNEDATLDSLRYHTYTVVGYISTPLYMDMSRGNTTLGNGSITALLYLPEDSFDIDYYSEIDVTFDGEKTIYTDAYHDMVQAHADRLEPLLQPIADERLQVVLKDAKAEYADGVQEYEDGLAEYEEGKAEAEAELAEAKKKLEDGEKEIEENRKKLEDGIPELEKGQEQIDSGKKQISQSKITLAKAKADAFSKLAAATSELTANYKELSAAIAEVNSGISQIDSGLTQIDSGISQLESGLQTLEIMIGVTDTLMDVTSNSLDRARTELNNAINNGADEATIAQLQSNVTTLENQLAEYEADMAEMTANRETYSKQLEELQVQREDLAAKRAELEAVKQPLEEAMRQVDVGFVELQSSQTQAENEFAAAEAQIEASELQLETAQAELDKSRKDLEDGQAKLEEAEKELVDGWDEYYKGETEAKQELADAEVKLLDAKQQLDDALATIESMDEAEVYALGRTANVGYISLESNSDIVEGVSAVFPAFFLLIAALVCITTMTRMVEEERTQIGTLKALGYSNGAIIGKYLAYAGSAAVIGCGLGVIIGSIAFPVILWKVYQILVFLGDYYVLQLNWPLCILVVSAYTAVTLLVTWYCCRMSLREVPAELIRPKPPTSGKKIFLERLPFWNRFSFLNKVMLRNIFRYRQRLLMMLVGIGGCTALLLTGFGIRDSIGDLPAYQFSEVVLYDFEVRFDHSMTEEEQKVFTDSVSAKTDGVFFYHQSSMELLYDSRTNDITFIAAESGISSFIDFHSGDTKIAMPGPGEALVSVGVADRLGIQIGDTISVRDADMRTLQLRVSGIYENNVYNYVVVSPETVMLQWEEAPDVQMACIHAVQNLDVHEIAATITEQEGVMNVTVNQDVEDQVSNMLDALDLVVVTVVICAGLLAVTVLYNLTNINITERIREIATIKVLGFNSRETAAYVFKENLLLSGMGAVLGLFGGVLLLEFVMSQIQVDMVWMTTRILPISYVLAWVITMLSAALVDFVLYFKLEKINMAEALKSVE